MFWSVTIRPAPSPQRGTGTAPGVQPLKTNRFHNAALFCVVTVKNRVNP